MDAIYKAIAVKGVLDPAVNYLKTYDKDRYEPGAFFILQSSHNVTKRFCQGLGLARAEYTNAGLK